MLPLFCSPLLSSLLLLTPALADTKPLTPSSIRGLDPSLFEKYSHVSSGNFTCLDGSITLPYTAINDDYCDCPDGSDEPGTSACGSGVFYCANEGHIPGTVLSSRVNDGVCDPECCDGSDEWVTGACPNRCAKTGKEYRERIETELKTRKTGAKIRSTYIKWAQGEKKRLQDEVENKREEVKIQEQEVEKARENLERSEAQSKESLERRKISPVYTSLLTHRLALARLRSKTSSLETEVEALHGILDDLSKGYNKDYHDVAVIDAVVGYEELSNTPSPEGEEEEIGDAELDELERKDLEALLLMDETESSVDEEGGILYRIDEYIPDALYGSWESVRDLAIDWMIRVGILRHGATGASKGAGVDGPHVVAAREKHTTLTNALNALNGDVRNAADTLEKMHTGFGPKGEWKKLDGTCVEKVSGEYTYEVCFFGRATQKSNKDGSSNYLGSFTSWNANAEEGSFEYYTRQDYRNGARCWNGPMRSATVDLKCGTTNALLSVSEPEKCEYFFKATSPALCWPLDGTDTGPATKEEL